VQQEASYNFALPSVNFTYLFTNDLQLRVGAAKTMARPSVDKLAPTNTTASISWGEFSQIFGGNAELKPYSARQADVSLEWYYAKDSALNFAVYQKNIKNQITTQYLTGQDIGVPGRLFNVSKPINGDKATARGFEIGLQHLWSNGFGVRAQYTRNKSRSLRRPGARAGRHRAGHVVGRVLYERGPWSMSATADHTDAFVTATNVLGAGFNERAKAVTWMTAQVAYEVNKWLRISIEGNNLTDATGVHAGQRQREAAPGLLPLRPCVHARCEHQVLSASCPLRGGDACGIEPQAPQARAGPAFGPKHLD
jgi:TonB-dependent receptor